MKSSAFRAVVRIRCSEVIATSVDGLSSEGIGDGMLATEDTGMLTESKPKGGSAMSCGLELPAAKANVAAADWLPEMRLAAAVYW